MLCDISIFSNDELMIIQKLADSILDPSDCFGIAELCGRIAYFIAMRNYKDEEKADELSSHAYKAVFDAFIELFT